jgi:D-2-hydroxyacid dehydrogenase (NADP+)
VSRRILVSVAVAAATLARIRATAPEADVEVAEGDEAAARLGEVEIAFGHFPPEAIAAAAPPLEWVQLPSAGVDGYLTDGLVASGVTLTSVRGMAGAAGAEHILGLMLMFNRGLKYFYDRQRERRWDERLDLALTLAGQTLGVVGLGGMGSALAERAKALGMRVLAIKREPGERPPYVDELHGPDGLHAVLAVSDHVALTLPITDETRNLVDRAALARAKPGAYLYNIGRGELIDDEALVDALRSGRLAGAGLDVFREEPLPPESPYWDLDNVLITPHLGGDTPFDRDHIVELFLANLERYRDGRSLLNVVDPARGY